MSKSQRDELAKAFPAEIDRHVMQVMVVSFKQEEFDVIAPANWKARFGSLHGVAVQLCLDEVGYHMDRRSNRTQIAYIIESGDDAESHIDSLFKRIAKPADRKRHWRYKSHTFANKGTARGLEVADYFAWHWNKYYAETVARPIRDMRKDLRAMIEKNPKKYEVLFYNKENLENFLINHGCTRTVQSKQVSPIAAVPDGV